MAKNKGGRPKAEIDPVKLEWMAEHFCTIEEIAATFRVHRDTIRNRFSAKIEECRERGKKNLREMMWHRAQQGSDKVILHMAQHYLSQHSITKLKSEITQTTTHNIQLEAKHTELLNLIRTMVSDIPLTPITPSLLPGEVN